MLCQFLLYIKVNQLHVCIYSLFYRFPSHLGHHGAQNRVCCAIQQVLISYLFYTQQCIYVNPNLAIHRIPVSPVSVHTFVLEEAHFIAEQQPILCHTQFIHSRVGGHLRVFSVRNISYKCLHEHMLAFLVRKFLGDRMAGSYGRCMIDLSNCSPVWLYQLTLPPAE